MNQTTNEPAAKATPPAPFPFLNPVQNEHQLLQALTTNRDAVLTEIMHLMAAHHKLDTEHAKLFSDNDMLLVDHAQAQEEVAELLTDKTKLSNQVETLTQQLAQFKNDPANQVALIQAQLTRLEVEKSQCMEIIRTQALNTGSSTRYTPEHPNPDTFHGDRKTLAYFIREMQTKLRRNADWYPDEASRLIYFKSRLRDKAYTAVQHGFGLDGTIHFPDVAAVITLLQQSFGDIDEEGTAQSDIMKLRQGHKPTIEFLQDWLAVASKTGFDDKAKIAHLKNALHPEVLTRLSQLLLSNTPIATNLTDFLAQIRHIDSVIRTMNPDYTKTKSPSTVTLTPRPFSVPEIANTPLTTSQGGDIMDLSALEWSNPDGTRRPKNDEERKARKAYNIKHGLCLWCDALGLEEEHPAELRDSLSISVNSSVLPHDVLDGFDRRSY